MFFSFLFFIYTSYLLCHSHSGIFPSSGPSSFLHPGPGLMEPADWTTNSHTSVQSRLINMTHPLPTLYMCSLFTPPYPLTKPNWWNVRNTILFFFYPFILFYCKTDYLGKLFSFAFNGYLDIGHLIFIFLSNFTLFLISFITFVGVQLFWIQ